MRLAKSRSEWTLPRSVLPGHLLSRARGSTGLEKPIARGACAPLPNSPGSSRTAGRAKPRPSSQLRPARAKPALPPAVLAQDVRPEGRFPPSPAKRSTIRCAQGVFRHEEHLQTGRSSWENRAKTMTDQRVDLCPQVVPILWTRGPRLFFILRQPLL